MARMSEPPSGLTRQAQGIAAQVAAIPRQTLEALDRMVANVMSMAALVPSIEELDALETAFMDLMVDGDWPPPLDVSLPEVRALMAAFEDDPDAVRRDLDAWVTSKCTEDGLRRALEVWVASPFGLRRREPLEAAVRAHLGGEFFCSVPVMLAQTEGLVCDFHGADREKYLTGHLVKTVRTALDSPLLAGVKGHVGTALCRYYLESVLKSVRSEAASEGEMRRHLILHGGDCSYGTPVMSWKSILLFDTVFESLDVVLIAGDHESYHLPICRSLKTAQPGDVTLVHMTEADKLRGRVPCATCRAPVLLASATSLVVNRS